MLSLQQKIRLTMDVQSCLGGGVTLLDGATFGLILHSGGGISEKESAPAACTASLLVIAMW